MKTKQLEKVPCKKGRHQIEKERKRLTKLYPWAVLEARGLGKDPIEITEKILREFEFKLRDRKFRESHGAR